VEVRIGRVRKRKERALRVEVRLGRVCRREGGISASRSKAWEEVTGENTDYKGLAGRVRLERARKRARRSERAL
jgi:hypothetical protein